MESFLYCLGSSRGIQLSAIFTLRQFFTINLLTIIHDAILGEFLISPQEEFKIRSQIDLMIQHTNIASLIKRY